MVRTLSRMDEHPLRRLWSHADNHRGDVVVASLWSFLNKVFDLAPPLLIGLAVDVVVERDDSFLAGMGIENLRTQLYVLAGLSAVIWILESVFEYLLGVKWRNLAQTIQHELRLDAYNHVQDLELAYFEDESTGGLLSVLNDDVNQLERFLDGGANSLIQLVTTITLIGGGMMIAVPGVAWIAFLPIPVIIIGSVKFQSALEPRYAAMRDQVSILNVTMATNLSGIATIKAFTAEARETERVRVESQEYRQRNADAIRLSSAFIPLIRMAILAAFCAILVLAGFRALDGSLAVATYSVMVFITQRLLWPLTALGETFDLYQRAMASTRRILDLLNVDPEIVSGPGVLDRPIRGEVRLEEVRFSYRTGDEVLHGLSIDVRAGETHAIVGSTGAGKSTLVKLLLRLYDPTGGRVTLDGVDLRELQLSDLRDAYALVSQDVFLFHGTVRENIAYGRVGASDEQVRHAADVAEAHEFIMSLPEGYDTVVGERGQKLSGGQRQRVSIARAVLRDPPVLLLDEATSAVDNETEAAIQRSLAKVSKDRTTFVIAHRLSTVRHAHTIHVLHAGQVVESGTHEELVALDGRYAALWRVQTGEAVPV